jgi:hypothetical protein
VPKTVFARHYFTSSLEYRTKVLDAFQKFRRDIDSFLLLKIEGEENQQNFFRMLLAIDQALQPFQIAICFLILIHIFGLIYWSAIYSTIKSSHEQISPF